jgi:hypothetical protein
MHPQQITGRSLEVGEKTAPDRTIVAGIKRHIVGVVGYVGGDHQEGSLAELGQAIEETRLAHHPGLLLAIAPPLSCVGGAARARAGRRRSGSWAASIQALLTHLAVTGTRIGASAGAGVAISGGNHLREGLR